MRGRIRTVSMNKVKTIAPANASVPRPVSAGTAGNPHEVKVEKQSSSSMKEIGGSGFELWDNSLLHRTAGTFAALTFEGESNPDVQKCEALDRRRGKGTRQIVRVERVVVNEGGQAIVGPVTAGVPMVRALGQGDAPMQASPIAASDTREGVEA